MGTYCKKDIAMGQYKSGGKVGRPAKRYMLAEMKHERTETKEQERAERRSGDCMACGGSVKGKKK